LLLQGAELVVGVYSKATQAVAVAAVDLLKAALI
jgi:hypothetical protein